MYQNRHQKYNQLTLDQFFNQVLIQSTFNEKNKDNSNDDNDDNHVQDVLASNQHQLLEPMGMNCTPRYQVDYAYAQGMLIMLKPWNKHNTLEHNQTHHRQRSIPNRCENVWLLGLINCDNLVADCLVARHSASQERSANNQVIRSLDDWD